MGLWIWNSGFGLWIRLSQSDKFVMVMRVGGWSVRDNGIMSKCRTAKIPTNLNG